MRVVIDTNVLVFGLLSPHGPPGRTVDLIVNGGLFPLYDDRILDEYRAVLRRERFGFSRDDVRDLLEQLEAVGEAVSADPRSGELPEPDDRPFLEVAASGRARFLVTGNQPDYDPISGTHSVPVVSPRRLIDEVREE